MAVKNKITINNVNEILAFSRKQKDLGMKKGVALPVIAEKFGLSVATAKSAYEETPEVLELEKAASNTPASNMQNTDTVTSNTKSEIVFDDGSSIGTTVDADDTMTFTGTVTYSKKIGKDLAAVAASEKFDQATLRTLVDMFYQAQERRIATQNQLRALAQGYDTRKLTGEEKRIAQQKKDNIAQSTALKWLSEQVTIEEEGLKEIINSVTEDEPVCKYLRQVHGIGPIYAAGLRGMLDVRRAKYASNFISYAGLNDRNCPWIGNAEFARISADIWGELGLAKGTVSREFLEVLAARTGRTWDKVMTAATTRWDARKRVLVQLKAPSYEALAKNMVKVPYNKRLKVHMFKIADRWNKMLSNKNSLYAQTIATRKVMEIERNERGDFANYAKAMLEKRNFKNPEVRKILESGKLSKGQLQLRSYRIANKLFLSHVFEAMYVYEYGCYPARYYSLDILGHQDEILPEVPFNTDVIDLFAEYEKRTGLKANRERKFVDINVKADTLRNRVEANVQREYALEDYLSDMQAYTVACERPDFEL